MVYYIKTITLSEMSYNIKNKELLIMINTLNE